MPRFNGHGGGCCGRREFAGFGGSSAQITNDFRQGLEVGKKIEVVLNNDQMYNQGFLIFLDRHGFVLTDIWDNSSGMRCFSFSRCDTRISFADVPAEIRTGWTGMTADSAYLDTGNLSFVQRARRDLVVTNQDEQNNAAVSALTPQRQTVRGLPNRLGDDAPERQVFSSFHNIYNGGRVGAGYPSIAAARNATRREGGEVREQLVFSTGRTEWRTCTD